MSGPTSRTISAFIISAAMASNEERSTSFYAPGVIDTDAWFRVAASDYRELIAGCDFPRLLSGVGSLFDAGCGLGKFPSLLAPALADFPGSIETDFLDPSAHCIEQFACTAPAPFAPRRGFAATIEEFAPAPGQNYDLVWAMQSIYAWDREFLAQSLRKLRTLAGAAGGVLVFQAGEKAFYHRFYNAYRAAFSPEMPAYIAAEEACAAFGADDCKTRIFRFDHVIPVAERALLETYLRQLCFDTSLTLEDIEGSPEPRALLDAHRGASEYRFAQEVWLIGSPGVMDTLGG